jgi:hypothetical protein
MFSLLRIALGCAIHLFVIQLMLIQDFYMTCYVLADSHSLDSVSNPSTDYINLQVQVFKFKFFMMPVVTRSMRKKHDSKITINADSSSSSLGNTTNLPVIPLPLSLNNIDSSSSLLQESSSLSVSLEHHFELSNFDGLEFSNFCHPCTALTTCPSSQIFRMEAECNKSDAIMKVDPDPLDQLNTTQDDIMKLLMVISNQMMANMQDLQNRIRLNTQDLQDQLTRNDLKVNNEIQPITQEHEMFKQEI